MKTILLIAVLAILLCLGGCVDQDNPAQITGPDNGRQAQLENRFIVENELDKEAVIAEYQLDSLNAAQGMAEAYIYAVQNGIDLAANEDAIAIFDLLFYRNTLALTELREAEYMPDAYHCDIVGDGPNGERKIPLYLIFEDNEPRISCPVIRYGVPSRNAVQTYLEYLADGNAGQLAQWLSVDGSGDQFINAAEQLLDYYQQYNLQTTQIINFDYNYQQDKIVYLVEDANQRQLEIMINYGDGLAMPDIDAVIDR